MSHLISEGRRCVEAAAKYKRIVQHGTQQRASTGRASEIAAVQSGKYGKLLVSKGYCCKPRWSIGTKPTEKPPAHLDFDLWLGPAREQPYHAQPGPLQLALVLGLRQRRHRQPGRPRDGRGPVGDPGRDAARPRSGAWAGGSGTRTRGRRRTPDDRDGVRRRAAGVRGPRAGREQDAVQAQGDERVLHDRGANRRRHVLPEEGRHAGEAGRDGREGHPRRGVGQLPARGPQPQAGGLQRRAGARPLLERPVPPGQHLVPARRAGAVRRQEARATTGRWSRRSTTSRRT